MSYKDEVLARVPRAVHVHQPSSIIPHRVCKSAMFSWESRLGTGDSEAEAWQDAYENLAWQCLEQL